MNYIFISPHLPPNYKQFSVRLQEEGLRVLGIGSEPYDLLDPELRSSLTEYYKVDNIHNYDQMLKACAFLTFKHGKIDKIESHKESYLDLDAKLREDFNVEGLKTSDLTKLREMLWDKTLLESSGISVPKGSLVEDLDQAKSFIEKNKYPVFIKAKNSSNPDYSYKLSNDEELDNFFAETTDTNYLIEEFILAPVVTFDGLTDKDGEIVSLSSMHYKASHMETMLESLDIVFHVQRQVSDDLLKKGKQVLEIFNIKERFFHIEFFKLENGDLILLDVKVRPPGGLCLDAINYADDSDIYRQYARMISGKDLLPIVDKPYYSSFIGLKINPSPPKHNINEAKEIFGNMIVLNSPSPPELALLMGEYAVVLRDSDEEVLKKAVDFIIER